MNTTSTDGSTATARSMRTASVIDAVRHRWGWNVSTAQRMIVPAASFSNRAFNSANSVSVNCGACTRLMLIASLRAALRLETCSCGALALTGFGHVGAGLVEVDVEVGALVRHGPVVEVLQLGADLLGPTDPVEPVAERLA